VQQNAFASCNCCNCNLFCALRGKVRGGQAARSRAACNKRKVLNASATLLLPLSECRPFWLALPVGFTTQLGGCICNFGGINLSGNLIKSPASHPAPCWSITETFYLPQKVNPSWTADRNIVVIFAKIICWSADIDSTWREQEKNQDTWRKIFLGNTV